MPLAKSVAKLMAVVELTAKKRNFFNINKKIISLVNIIKTLPMACLIVLMDVFTVENVKDRYKNVQK